MFLNLCINTSEKKEKIKIKEIIFNKISEKYSSLNKDEKRNCILTIKIKKEDSKEIYPADIEEFVEIFRDIWFESLFSKYKEIAKGKGICAFCGKEDEVMPASPFAVFTVKKVGFAYYFDRQNSWKQLPICEKCALDLQVGKEWIMDTEKLNLSFTLYSYRYFVIPKFIFKEVSEEVITEIELWNKRKSDYREGLMKGEEDILDIIKGKEDVLNLIFVFYKIKQQYFDIIRYVEDVPPSWIKKIYDTFRSINQKSIFKEDKLKALLGEKWSSSFLHGIYNKPVWDSKEDFKKLAQIIKDFFYHREKDRKVFDKSSLNILGDILEAKQIDKRYLVKNLIEAIREDHIEANKKKERTWNEKLLALKSLYLLDFLLELDLVLPDYPRVEKFKESTIRK